MESEESCQPSLHCLQILANRMQRGNRLNQSHGLSRQHSHQVPFSFSQAHQPSTVLASFPHGFTHLSLLLEQGQGQSGRITRGREAYCLVFQLFKSFSLPSLMGSLLKGAVWRSFWAVVHLQLICQTFVGLRRECSYAPAEMCALPSLTPRANSSYAINLTPQELQCSQEGNNFISIF